MPRPAKIQTRTQLFAALQAIVACDAVSQLDAIDDKQAASIAKTLKDSVMQSEDLCFQLISRERELLRGL